MTPLRPFQANIRTAIYNAWAGGARNVMPVLPTGGGKCLGKGTPILMFDGTIKLVEDVIVGDLLMGPDSKARTVLSVCTGRENLYRVTPKKGDPYVVNESHVLSLKYTGIKSAPKYSSQGKYGNVINLSVLDYLNKSKTFKHITKGWRASVEFATKYHHFALPPYFLGLWLGDGSARNTGIATQDIEIIEYLNVFANGLNLKVREESAPGKCSIYHIVSHGEKTGRGGNHVNSALYDENLKSNKHLPHKYLTGNRNQRLALLAGLLDSDGSYTGKGYDFINKNLNLIKGVVFLARSLGFSAYVKSSMKSCNGGVKAQYFRCTISGDIDEIPCKIERKKAKPRLQKKSVLVTSISLAPIGEGDYYGFEIDGDRLFMLGDFTVTHNTVLFGNIIAENTGSSVAIAHRQELTSQISLALARNGVRHRVIGAKPLQREIVSIHMAEVGRDYTNQYARTAVAGVDTLLNLDPTDPIFQASLVVQDEGHHVLEGNKWGKAMAMFPVARGLFPTATPKRADRKGLGRHADGLVDALVVGPSMRELINMGYLTDYRIFAPPCDVDMSQVGISDATGDYNQVQLRNIMHESKSIVGDVVSHYLRIAPGKLGVTFAVDVEEATKIAAEFRAKGVPAEVVSAKTPASARSAILRRFKNREVLQLVNVDLFGEGFDLPAIEVVSMARPTMSYSLFCQQFGRALRLMISAILSGAWDTYSDEQRRGFIAESGKPHAIIIDHVSNVLSHGLPDAYREWSLDRGERRSRGRPNDVIPCRTCLNPACIRVYERSYVACPYCGDRPVPADRSAPDAVDGDLMELDPSVLRALRGEIERIESSPYVPVGLRGSPAEAALINRHRERQAAQTKLKATIALWAGYHRHLGRADAEVYRRFFFMFGTDIATAQTLNTADATALEARIAGKLLVDGIVSASV